MPTFQYEALDRGGQEITGTVEAPSESSAISQLRDRGYRPFDVSEQSEGFGLGLDFDIPFLGGNSVGQEEVTLFTRQMATLLSAGLPLLKSVNIMEEQTENEEFQEILDEISSDIKSGSSFSEALQRHPNVFDELYINMIKAGEVGGVLEVVLERLAEFAEKAQELRAKMKSATIYPGVMFTVAVLVVGFLLVFVLPTFVELFNDMGVDLPLPTVIVISVSNFMINYWWLLIIALVGAFYAVKWYYSTDSGEYVLDNLKLNLPVFGELFRKAVIARFTRTFATLIRSGVPILEAIEIVQDTVGNRVIGDMMDDVYDSISEGDTISEPLYEAGEFPPMVVHMISVGEETGNLDDMLTRIADTYEMEVEEMVEGLGSLLEPLLILFMGGAIGIIVMALFLPMFQIVQVVG